MKNINQRPKKQSSKNKPKKKKEPVRKAPVAMSRTVTLNKMPRTTLVSNREMFPNFFITPPSAPYDTINYLTINFGKPSSFPWISGIAQHYEYYRIRSLQINFVPSCGTATSGTIAMAIDYDATDAAPKSLAEMSQMRGFKSANVWAPLSIDFVNKNTTIKKFYVREGPNTTTIKDRWNDAGSVYIMCEACQYKPGNVYLNYTVEFINPQPYTAPVGTIVLTNPPDKTVPLGPTLAQTTGQIQMKVLTPVKASISNLIKGKVYSYVQGTGVENLLSTYLNSPGLTHEGMVVNGTGTQRTDTYNTNGNWDPRSSNEVNFLTTAATTLEQIKLTMANYAM